MKCKQCSKEYEAKGRSLYCSNSCKQAFYRNRMKPVRYDNVTIKTNVTKLEKCRYCGKDLPKLSRPRRSPGACYPCALDQPSKPQPPATDGHTVSSKPISMNDHRMTKMEMLFYRPASLLKPGQTNFVSLPGRACYYD